jgi:hypothetical protein
MSVSKSCDDGKGATWETKGLPSRQRPAPNPGGTMDNESGTIVVGVDPSAPAPLACECRCRVR